MAESDAAGPAQGSAGGSSYVNGAVAAQLLMITPPRFRECISKGWIIASGRDRYSLVDVVQGYLRHVRGLLLPEDEASARSTSASRSRRRP